MIQDALFQDSAPIMPAKPIENVFNPYEIHQGESSILNFSNHGVN